MHHECRFTRFFNSLVITICTCGITYCDAYLTHAMQLPLHFCLVHKVGMQPLNLFLFNSSCVRCPHWGFCNITLSILYFVLGQWRLYSFINLTHYIIKGTLQYSFRFSFFIYFILSFNLFVILHNTLIANQAINDAFAKRASYCVPLINTINTNNAKFKYVLVIFVWST